MARCSTEEIGVHLCNNMTVFQQVPPLRGKPARVCGYIYKKKVRPSNTSVRKWSGQTWKGLCS